MRRSVTVALLVALTVTCVLPPIAAAATTSLRAYCSANLRTHARVTATVKTTLKSGGAVKADALVSGGPWKATCQGRTVTGVRWYRIVSIGGVSVSRLYGVPYLYGARALFGTIAAPAAGGTWFGHANPWAGMGFGSFPNAPAGQMWISGDQHGRTISRLTFRNRPAGRNVLVLDGVSNLTIDLIDFDTVPEGIYINASHDVTIRRIRARNIFGPLTRTGFHSGNLIQTNDSSRLTITDFIVLQPHTIPADYNLPPVRNPNTGQLVSSYGTEDIVSLGGQPGRWGNITIARFKIDGGAWQSWSGTGMFLGDGRSGHDITVRDGLMLNPGQVGIGTGEE